MEKLFFVRKGTLTILWPSKTLLTKLVFQKTYIETSQEYFVRSRLLDYLVHLSSSTILKKPFCISILAKHMTYHFLEHTADEKFAAEGKTLEETFSFAAEALKEAICGKITVLEQETKAIEIKGDNLENLLYKFLEEFIFFLDSEDFLISKVTEIKIDQEKFILTANLIGDKGENYKFTNDVKAVTYNEMFVRFNQEKSIWECQVVLDV